MTATESSNKPALRALPREERDLFIGADNGHVAAFDNLSGLRQWISDALCRLATGGGFGSRGLYTDQDEMLFDAMRPIILNGIDDFVVRGDLADRSVLLLLNPISDDQRRTEQALFLEFKAAHAAILGALLDAVVHGLRELPNIRLARLPRMADFAVWATACEGALWTPDTFTAAYNANRADATETVIEADAVATAVRALMAKFATWTGTATELMPVLLMNQPPDTAKMRNWPQTARVLSVHLRRAAPSLRRVGIHVELGQRVGHRRDRKITITVGAFPSAPSASSATGEITKSGNGLEDSPQQTQNRSADASDAPADDTLPATVRSNPLEKGAADGADDADAKIPPLVGGEAS